MSFRVISFRTILFILFFVILASCTFRKGLGDYVNKDAIYVSLEGSDANDGTIYSPVRTISKGISLMRDMGYKTIKVAKGVYYAGDGFTHDPVSGLIIDFSANGGFTLEGGWELDFSEKTDLTLEEDFSILDGDFIVGTVLTVRNTSNVVIDGFIIRHNMRPSSNRGGGVYVYNSSNITLNDSVIHSNTASDGAGIFVEYSNTVNIDRVGLIYNSATGNGGGAAFDSSQNVTFSNSLFQDNSSDSTGGGLFIWNCQSFQLTNNFFERNETPFNGGAVSISTSSNMTIEHNGYIYNRANNGGGLFLANSSYININENIFETNISSTRGGGAHLLNSNSITVSETFFKDNSSDQEGGGLYSENNSYLRIFESAFSQNRSGTRGGAIAFMMNVDHTTDLVSNQFGGNIGMLTNSTVDINNSSGFGSNLNIEGNNFAGTGPFTGSIAIAELPYDISGHSLRNNIFHASTFDFYYNDNGNSSKSISLLNSSGDPSHDAAIALNNVEQ